MINQTTIVGILGKDAEVRSAGGQWVINYPIACSESWKDANGEKKERTYWTDCDQWFKNEQSANNLAEYLTKGSRVTVQGLAYPRAYIKQGTKEAVGVQCLRVRQLEIQHSTKKVSSQQTQNDMPPVENQGDDDLPF